MRASRLCAAAVAAAALTLTPPLVTGAAPPAAAQQQVYTAAVVDEAGVLSADQLDELNSRVNESGRSVQVVLVPSFGGVPAERFTDAVLAQNGGASMVVLAIATQDRQFGISGGTDWTSSELDALYDATRDGLSTGIFEGTDAFVSKATGEGGGVPWPALLAVLLIAGAGIGGAIWWSRRRSKTRTSSAVASARNIDPSDVDKLGELSTPVLASLADAYVIDTDETIREADEELRLATSEFGEQRTRPFAEALARARAALDRANETHLRLTDAIPESEPQRRGMLIDVITDAGTARAELDQRAEEFAKMRDLLVNADSAIAELTRRTVDLTRRLPLAETTLTGLRQRYQPAALTSVADNAELARDSLAEANRGLDEAGRLAALPPGEQGALVATLRAAEHAAEIAENNLTAIEHADANIAAARASLPALIAEVDGEIPQVGDAALAREAEAAVAAARAEGEADPLTHLQRLTDIDSRLDAAIAQRRESERAEALLRQQLDAARTAVQAAEDFIAARGRIVGASARTALSQAKATLQRAQVERNLELGRRAAELAHSAQRAAQGDVTSHHASEAGRLVTGVLIGSMLSGGFRGGGGGGGFGGGGFRGGRF